MTKTEKREAKKLEPIIRIGKNGLTPETIKEIKKLLEKKRLIKIKFLKSALQNKNRKELAKELAEKTSSTLVDVIGFVAVLNKKI